MKKLFCVVVTDPDYVIGLDSPIIFHIECENKDEAEDFVLEDLSSEEDYGYDPEDVKSLDIFAFPVTDANIIEV